MLHGHGYPAEIARLARSALLATKRMQDPRFRTLERYIQANLLIDPGQELTPDTRLVTEGFLDSMGIVMLAAFVEDEFGVQVDDAELREGQLETIAAILALVDERR